MAQGNGNEEEEKAAERKAEEKLRRELAEADKKILPDTQGLGKIRRRVVQEQEKKAGKRGQKPKKDDKRKR
jgi:hypothetical protein